MPLRTLIVDDEPIARKVLREELDSLHDVEIIGEADNGALALEKISADHPDLVLLDLQMPEMGGLEVVRNLKPGTHMPVIVIVTAYDTCNTSRRRGKRTWFAFNWRFDGGLGAGPVPCAGGEACPNGPNRSDTLVDVFNLTPDQHFEGGLYCGNVHATRTTPISPNGLCPANLYGSNLVSIPCAIQPSFHVQRNALRESAHGDRNNRVPFLGP